jgi:hypothetical protein
MSVVLGLVTGHVVFNWADIAVEKGGEDNMVVAEGHYGDDAGVARPEEAGRECAIKDTPTERHCCC